MGALEQMCCGGGVFLTADACRRIDESIQKGIDQAVARSIEQMQRMLAESHTNRDWHTYKEFCDEHDVVPATIRNWAKDGIVEIKSIGGRRYVRTIQPDAVEMK